MSDTEPFGSPVEGSEQEERRVLIPPEERDDFRLRFIRRGTNNPTDFGDRIVRKHYGNEAAQEGPSPQERVQKLYEHYKDIGKLIEFQFDEEIIATPLLIREYRVGDEKLNVGYGIGHPKDDDTELSLVIATWERGEVMLMTLPENGVEGVPATHGVDEFLDWMEDLYPRIHK